ncbi:sarcolemmal membrane-associated, partial [Olea europaea subsp. europaea]
MAGLLAWAADVVGGNGGGRTDEENYPDSIPLIFTPEQQTYVQELDRKAASLNRSIQDLRQRLPPPDISQRLPHLHAHSLASNAALALQLNAHSTTKQQVQQREVRLQEENTEYENAISSCENKIQEKLQEADALQSKLKVRGVSKALQILRVFRNIVFPFSCSADSPISVDREQKSRRGQFRHFSRLCRNGLKFDRLIGNKKSRRGQFRHFSRLCRNGPKFERLIGNKNRAGDNFVIFRDY